jgi:hypothetical protein
MPNLDVKTLVEMLQSARSVRNDLWQERPVVGSMAFGDIAASEALLGTPEPGRRIYELANLWLLLSAEELYGIGSLLDEGSSWVSIFPLLRSTMEMCGGVLWLVNLEPIVERAARAAVAILDGSERQVEVMAKWGKGSSDHRLAKLRRDDLLSEFCGEFRDVSISPSTVQGIRMPDPAAFMVPIADRGHPLRDLQGIYAHLCGMGVHPTAGFGGLIQQGAADKAEISMSDETLFKYLLAGLEPFLLALGALASAMGWDRSKFDSFHGLVVSVLPTGAI